MKIGTPLDNDGSPPDYHAMEARVAKLEAEITTIKIDVAVIKQTCATKSDLAELKAAMAEGHTKIIVWVVSAVFIAQLLPLMRDFVRTSAPATAQAPAPAVRSQYRASGLAEPVLPHPLATCAGSASWFA